jgi:hypothetical protein
MTTAARLPLLELESLDNKNANRRRNFAEPGKPEWDC